jgi:hypothetical protein
MIKTHSRTKRTKRGRKSASKSKTKSRSHHHTKKGKKLNSKSNRSRRNLRRNTNRNRQRGGGDCRLSTVMEPGFSLPNIGVANGINISESRGIIYRPNCKTDGNYQAMIPS